MWKSPLYFGLQYNLHESVLRIHLAGNLQSRKSFLFAERFLRVHGQCPPLAASPADQGEVFTVYHLKYIPPKQTWTLHKRAGVFQGYQV